MLQVGEYIYSGKKLPFAALDDELEIGLGVLLVRPGRPPPPLVHRPLPTAILVTILFCTILPVVVLLYLVDEKSMCPVAWDG